MKNYKFLILVLLLTIIFIFFSVLNVFAINDDKTIEEGSSNENLYETETDAENLSTIEIPDLTDTDEQALEFQEIEVEGFEEQGKVEYNGSEKTPNVTVGKYAGLTYYSQMDSRWKNKLYTSIGDSAQTIGISGCGPTAGAMVVSSIVGNITPDIMADLYVKYGYRSANQGTYWSAFKWTADVFDIGYSETNKLDEAIEKIQDNNYVIVSCNQGLFTYGGHLIVLIGVEGDKIKIFDPYLYSGKYDVSSRRGLATVNGNTVYVSIENFRKYANYRKFFCFKNDRANKKENDIPAIVVDDVESDVKNVNYQVRVNANSGLNIRNGAGVRYTRIGGYSKDSVVTIIAEINGWGKTDKGWICLDYTTKVKNNTISNIPKANYSTGNYRVNASVLNVRTGPGTNYDIKLYYQLTANALNQNSSLGNYYTNGYRKGVVCTVYSISGNWGKTNSGWVCLDYCSKVVN